MFSGRAEDFNFSFYPWSIKEWYELSEGILNTVSINKFKEIILSFLRLKENPVFPIHDIKGIKLFYSMLAAYAVLVPTLSGNREIK